MFSECKIFLVENILRKGKHFLLFDCVVEITPENYFLCLLLDVKNLFSKNVSPSQPSPPTPHKNHQNIRISISIRMNEVLVHGWYLLHNILQCFDIFKHSINEWAYQNCTFLLLNWSTSKPLANFAPCRRREMLLADLQCHWLILMCRDLQNYPCLCGFEWCTLRIF